MMEELKKKRKEIDEIDKELASLLARREGKLREVATLKRDNNKPIFDARRETEIIKKATKRMGSENAAIIFNAILSASRQEQKRFLSVGKMQLLPKAKSRRKKNITVSYQGIPGSWGEEASLKVFAGANLRAEKYFEDVFTAVRDGKADYGVVPIENSDSGAIGETYDLLKTYGSYIIAKTWINIRQVLLGVKGAKVRLATEVISHPEAFKQCHRFLRKQDWKLTPYPNTAVAAERVKELGDPQVFAIASKRAAELTGLKVASDKIEDSLENKTAFVVIAKEPEYDEASKFTAITFATPHKSGALTNILMILSAYGINLIRLESRPAGGKNYRFFCDIEGNVKDSKVKRALETAFSASEYFEVLGCYKEV
jgi:chorismate mutase/prephenate dehydratase